MAPPVKSIVFWVTDSSRAIVTKVIYQRELEIEMQANGVPFHREFELPIIYKEHQIGTRRGGFFSRRKNIS